MVSKEIKFNSALSIHYSNHERGSNLDDLTSTLEIILTQYQDMGGKYNPWEFAHLQEESKKGLDEFAEACRVVFGNQLPDILSGALVSAEIQIEHTYRYMGKFISEEEACDAIELSDELVFACKQICEMQLKCQGSLPTQSNLLTENVEHYAQSIRSKLDKLGVFCGI